MRALYWCLGAASLGLWLLPANAVNPLPTGAFAMLPDPTRPPHGLMPVPAGAAATPEASAAASAASAASAPAAAPALLTLVRVDATTGRGLAVIGGRMVAVGDRMLRTSRGLRRLSLWSTSNKASETPTAAAMRGGKDQP
jgi:hypothetical protein